MVDFGFSKYSTVWYFLGFVHVVIACNLFRHTVVVYTGK